MSPNPSLGDHCTGNHGNAGPCTWDGQKWTRDDGLKPCPFESSN